jgi:hypothetical protein
MKFTNAFSPRALAWRALAASVLLCAAGLWPGPATLLYVQAQQTQSQRPGTAAPVPEAERQAAMKIQAALDIPAKFQAASEFIQQYPKSALRPRVAATMAEQIDQVTDQAQKITLAENFLTIFKETREVAMITPLLVEAYLRADRIDDCFRVGSAWLEKSPEDAIMLTQLALIGIDQVKRSNAKFAAQSQQYGTRAITLLEGDKKSETMTDMQWGEYKTRWLPQLYQSMGILALVSGNRADAKAKLDQAVALNANDPFTYVMLGGLVNEEYQEMAGKFKAMAEGAAKDEMLKQIQAKIDEIIGFYAQAIALASGNPQYQQLHDQIRPDLEAFYKYRHNGSTDGLQQLIDKHKKP